MADSERLIWEGKPSQLTNLGSFFWGIILLWIPTLIRVIRTATTNYRVTDQRVTRRFGILSKRTDNLELYRVSDFVVEEPLLLRIFGKVNVILKSADVTHPNFLLSAVPKLPALTEDFRRTIESVRDSRGVRVEEHY